MKLEKEYGARYDFKYYLLIPESVEECAICEKLSKEYPDCFEILIEKPYCQPYIMKLIIKKEENKNETT